MPARIAEPKIETVDMFGPVVEDSAVDVIVFVCEQRVLGRLEDLKRIIEQSDAWYARHIALIKCIGGSSILEILLPLRQSFRLVRNLAVRRINYDTAAGWNSKRAGVVLQIKSSGGIAYLPNALQIGRAIGRAGRFVGLRCKHLGGCTHQGQNNRICEPNSHDEYSLICRFYLSGPGGAPGGNASGLPANRRRPSAVFTDRVQALLDPSFA